jgi:hypothetical protein
VKAREFWVLTVFGASALLLVIYNITQYRANRDLQLQFTQESQYIQQSTQLQALNNQIIQALAELAARDKDAAVRELLERNGITFQPAPAAEKGK